MQFFDMLKQFQEKRQAVSVPSCVKNKKQSGFASMRSGIALTYQAMTEGKRYRLLPVFRLQLVLQAVHIPVDGVV